MRNRLTHKRESGIKTGYWSPNKKQELIDRLAEYESTGLSPEQLKNVDAAYKELSKEVAKCRWIPVEERLPDDDEYILVSFSNYPIPDIGRYEWDEEGGAFYPGDDETSYVQYGLFVNAWMPLPKNYKTTNEVIT